MTLPYFEEIDRLYREILQRPVDPSGYDTYSRLMECGELTLDGLAEILRTSEEFTILVHQPDTDSGFAISDALEVANRRPKTASISLCRHSHGTVAVTIASKRYVANARVTAESFRSHHPDVPFLLLLADENDGFIHPEEAPFELVQLDEIGIPALHEFTFQYTELEVSHAALPFLLDFLFAAGAQRIVFLKQETLVLGNLEDLLDRLGEFSFFATPHLCGPPRMAEPFRAELDVLRAGVFNCGILGVANTAESRRFLEWWMERTYRNCYRLVEHGLHFEQRWLDFLPAFVSNLLVVRDPGVNVGHWNVLDRDVRLLQGSFTANGMPLRLFRFSGFDPERPERLTRYKVLEARDLGDVAGILRMYDARLRAAGHDVVKTWPYAWEAFDNGVQIPEIARRIYRGLDAADRARFGDPRLDTEAAGSFFAWLRAPVSSGSRISNLWHAIYAGDATMRLRFPRIEALASAEFADWWRQFRAADYGLLQNLGPVSARTQT